MDKRGLNVLLIHQYFLSQDEGGGSRWNEMASEWSQYGANITVLAGMVHYSTGVKAEKYKGKLFHTEYHEEVEVIRCHVSEAYNLNFIGRLWAYFSFVFFGIWAGLFKAKKPYDIIVVTSPPLFVGIIALVLSFFKKTPYIFEVRDLWPESAIDTGVLTNKLLIKFAYWFEKLVYKKAKLINVLTPAFRKVLIEKKGIQENKLILIPNAADFSLSDELLNNFDATGFKKQLGFEGKFVVTYVGAHGLANHLEQVLETAKLLKETNTIFLLIGNGMQKKKLIDQTMDQKIDNVKFIDSVPKKEVFKYILASDMGASVLKKNDTFKTIYSNKTFDYMACKKPIIMAIDGISRDLIEKAEAGVFVEPENQVDFSEKVKSYINNPQKCREEGANGYSFAKLNFDRKVLSQNYFKIIQSVSKHN